MTASRKLEINPSAMCRTTEFRVDKNSVDKCRKAIEQFVAYVKAKESGTLLYLSLQDQKDATRFLHLMVFADPRAMVEHAGSTANKEFITALYPEIQGGVVISDFVPVAAT
jgi:quinol monooxygenase YgiN